MTGLDRLLNPRSIAVVGGGAWCAAVIARCRAWGFDGALTRVHPRAGDFDDIPTVARVQDLAQPPDAVFVGVNRDATIPVIAALSQMGAGGAVCFASAFSEAASEDASAHDSQAQLIAAAGDMPILGPNCYGFINALDGAALWPDQHGLETVSSGVGLIAQSSNIALNLTMQSRGLPISHVITVGNQAVCSQADVALSLLEDPRVRALGCHVEGFGDLGVWAGVAERADALGKSVVVLKSGKSDAARAGAVTHTASLAGGAAAASTLITRFGFIEVENLTQMIEALKIVQTVGRLSARTIGSISCSGGEAGLVADMAATRGIDLPPLAPDQETRLRAVLGPKVALANPLDYHTYIWRDADAMEAAWLALDDPRLALLLIVLDFPRADRCDPGDWDAAVTAAIGVAAKTKTPVAVVASLPELLPEPVAQTLLQAGVVPLCGLGSALDAIAAATQGPAVDATPPIGAGLRDGTAEIVFEAEAKTALAAHGVPIPAGGLADTLDAVAKQARDAGFPVAIKRLGLAHKTDSGGVRLNVTSEDAARRVAQDMGPGPWLVEKMVQGARAEVLLGVTRDPAHGFLLTIGTGGTLTELMEDTASVLFPTTPEAVKKALSRLKLAKLLQGVRGASPVDTGPLLAAVAALQDYVIANADHLEEVEVNPLIVTPTQAVAADALIRRLP